MRLIDKIHKGLAEWVKASPYDIIIPNFYYGMYEMDLFRLLTSGYVVEYEIKVTKADFRKDFKKNDPGNAAYGGSRAASSKHDALAKGVGKPNRFFFVVPEDLVQPSDCPRHAGLIYYGEYGFSIQKNAPLLHKSKADPDVYRELAKSLSFREQRLRSDLRWMKYKQQDHLKLVDRLRAELKQFDPKNLTLFINP